MKNRKSLLPLSILLTTCAACNQPSEEVSEEPETEFVIKDENLIHSNEIDDNYRVFYEIFTGSFSDSNGDGIGDLRGIINRLDYLNDGDLNSGKSLGVQGLWLTPIFQSPTYHKYDVTDYYKIDPDFGTMDDLVELINKCHERNVKIIIDLPINHTGHVNKWFLNFSNAHKANDPTDPYYDYYCYYTSGDPVPSGRNFSSIYGSNDFYECNFSGNMPELNYDNETVRQEVLAIAKYYLDLGVDGFRFDAAKYIYYGDNTKSAEFWGWYMDELRKIKPDIYTVGEVWDSDAITDYYYKQGLDCFNFSMSQAEGKIAKTAKRDSINAYTAYIENYLKRVKSFRKEAMIYPFISNHDMDRAAGFVQLSTKQAHVAASLYILSSGSPFMYYGEEIGMKGSRGSASSDANRRLAMMWGDEDTIKDPREATYKSKHQINGTVADHLIDEKSLLNHYKRLIMIRNANPEIARGEYKALKTGKDCMGGFISTYNGKSVMVIHNTGTSDYVVDISTLTNLPFTTINGIAGDGTAKLEGTTLTISMQTSVVLR